MERGRKDGMEEGIELGRGKGEAAFFMRLKGCGTTQVPSESGAFLGRGWSFLDESGGEPERELGDAYKTFLFSFRWRMPGPGSHENGW
uniref:Uncharacterized protein n=1 Tax=Candidatus Kentrum sp. TC TaxID=2126339 RepID=A0A450Y988_9GAMM|nr:MAG: hypothetical protein BECKTC1821D_GA0114238_100363 [Candidatus Kentron sp. TC]